MQRLVTGTYSSKVKRRHNGFTLIEILVVVLIIGIVIGFAALLFNNFFKARRVKSAAEKLSLLIPLASQQAILQPAILGLAITDRYYQFYIYKTQHNTEQDKWQPLTRDHLLNQYKLPSNVKVQITINNKKNNGLNNDLPQIVFSSTGDNTPFTITISNNGDAPYYQITGTRNGEFHLKELTDENSL